MKPLEGVTVVDLTTFVAAPVCGRLLSDMGARVIKVEAARGDTWRGTGRIHCPDRYGKDENPVFDIYNSGKEFISLNLKSPEGMKAMMELRKQREEVRNEQMKQILNADQYEKYLKYQEEQRERMRQMRGRRGHGRPGGAPRGE